MSWLLGGFLGAAIFAYLCSWAVVSFVPAEHWPYREVKFEEHGHLYVDRYFFSYRARGEIEGWSWPWQPLPTPVDRAELSMPAVRISDESGDPLYLHHHSPSTPSTHRFNPNTRARLDITQQNHEVQVPRSHSYDFWLSRGGALPSPATGSEVFADELLRSLWSQREPGSEDAEAVLKLRLIYQSVMAGKPTEQWDIEGLRFDLQQSEAIVLRDPFRRSVAKIAWLFFAALMVAYLYLTFWIVTKRRHWPRVCRKSICDTSKSHPSDA